MKVLVTGAGGFAGWHVVADLAAAGHEPLAMDRPGVALPPAAAPCSGDVLDREATGQRVAELQPGGCIHLAGVAFVPMGWTDPDAVFSSNVLGTVRVLEAFRRHAPAARVLVVTSAEVYGRSGAAGRALDEAAPLEPDNLYALSKRAADGAARMYAEHYGMRVLVARPGNHIGPGQSSRFVATGFAEQVAAIALGRAEPVVRVGNLDSLRDFLDVRDVARAYRLLLERGRPGEAYNIASGKQVRVGDLLDELCRLAGIRPRIEVDPARYRPADVHGGLDCGKIRRELGWAPAIPLSDTLRTILDDARQRLAKAE
ncbi:MAG: GDP-mannose 4,6-dehydratase [Kiritimatiellae bacterium]|nr:GDP-mannose 4,6-dehydratase [Kiritimatiellia bacterium]